MGELLYLGEKTKYPIENNMGINSHTCVFGNSGSGKSHSIVKPNIFSFSEAGSSMIISDPKGALEKEFKDYLENKGYKIYSTNLVNPEQSSCGFNPLDYVCSEIDFIKLAHRIIYSDQLSRTSRNQDPYWNHMAEILLSLLLEMVVMVENEATFDKVIYYASRITADGTGKTNIIMNQISKKRSDCLAAKQWLKIKTLLNTEKTFSCVVSSVQEHLGRYESMEMTEFFHKKQILDFESFGERPSVLFLKISDTDDTYYDFANIIYAQAIDSLSTYADGRASGNTRIPVRFILDDFSTNVFIESMPKVISVARARNISFMLICQSVQQLKAAYADDAHTIISNTDNIVFLSTNDVETAKEFSTRLDLPVFDILYKKRERIYIFRSGEHPIEDNRYDYRKHPSYKELQMMKIR